ncbi:membrane-associating domain-containing protein [Geopyxis carbonaria]|nr:membrane-associating domain-containing protein [Geopyxis carbonaria]
MASAGKITNIVMRFLQFLFTLLVLALSGALIEQQLHGGTPTRVNYSIFTAAFALLSLFYLIPASFMESIRAPLATTLLDALNFIFLLCAGIAMAAQLNGNNCRNRFFVGHNGITSGGGYVSPTRRCREANAMTAFEWFAAVAFLVSLLIGVHEWRKSGATARLGRGRPSMRGVGGV